MEVGVCPSPVWRKIWSILRLGAMEKKIGFAARCTECEM
jgi:hypothetical protein